MRFVNFHLMNLHKKWCYGLMINRKKPEVFVNYRQQDNLKTMIIQDKIMDRTTKIILSILCVFVIFSTILGLYSSIGFTGEFTEINKRLDSINDTVFRLTDTHFLGIVDEMKDSTYVVASIPINPSETTMGSFFVDEKGNIWNKGSGFAISDDGYILTADHVVSNSKVIYVLRKIQNTISWIPARKINSLALPFDIALIKIDNKTVPIKIGDGYITIGQKVAFTGYPLGKSIDDPFLLAPITHEGIVSSITIFHSQDKDIPILTINSFVNFGNSGGPVFSKDTGNVIGIISQRQSVTELPITPQSFEELEKMELNKEEKKLFESQKAIYEQLSLGIDKNSQAGIVIFTPINQELINFLYKTS